MVRVMVRVRGGIHSPMVKSKVTVIAGHFSVSLSPYLTVQCHVSIEKPSAVIVVCGRRLWTAS